jgi:hypothetical protein
MSVLSASFATTASFALNVPATASFAVSASYATNAELLDGLDSTAFVLNSQTSSMSVASASFATTASYANFASTSTSASYATNAGAAQTATSASYATTAGFAQTIASGLNITASNILVTNDLVVNGTASFGYTQTISGSAVIIGDEFIILNASTPTSPFAGIKVYDTGSNSTASLEWNGNGDYWIQVDEAGESAAMLTGASGSKGSEVFPTSNRLIKGTGNSTVVDSNISDNGSIVSINSNTQVTGSLTVSGNITGSNLRVENNTHLDGQLRVTNDAQFDTHILIQGAQPHVKLRDTSGGGFSSGYDIRIDTGSFEIYDDTHDRNVLSDIFDPGTGKHTTILSSEIVVISGSDSVTVLGPLTASLFGTASFATTASYALSASQAQNAVTANSATTATSASFATNSTSASYALNSTSASYALTASFALNVTPTPTGSFATTGSNTFIGDQVISGSLNISGSYSGSNVVGNWTDTFTQPKVNQIVTITEAEYNTVSGSTEALNTLYIITDSTSSFATSASYAISSSFATTASYVLNSIPAFPYTGNAQILGNLLVTGSIYGQPTYAVTERPFTINEGGDGTSAFSNLIFDRNTTATATGSVDVSGSNNFISLNTGTPNATVTGGGAGIIRAANSIVLGGGVRVTGSNGSGYTRTAPSLATSINSGLVTVTDNRPTTTTAPLSFTSNNNNGNITATLTTGSLSLSNNMMFGGSGTIFNVTGSAGAARTINSNILGGFSGNTINFETGGNVISSMLLGNFLTASFTDSTNNTLNSVSVLGYQLAISASGPAGSTTLFGSTYLGRWNAIDSTSYPGNTVFAIGTGTSNAARRTSLFVSASGLTTVRDLSATGSLEGTASFANNASTAFSATSASFALTASYALNGGGGAGFPYTGNAQIDGNLGVTGSTRGNIITVTAVSNTGSIDLNEGNAFTFTTAASNFIQITNYPTGSNQKFSLLIANGVTSGSVTFGSTFLFPAGATYTPSPASGSIDILTFETYTY